MAKTVGESGRFTSQEAANRHERVVLRCMIIINQLNDEIRCGHKILREYSYNVENRRLEITLGSGADEGSTPVVIERATPPEGLAKFRGQEIYGARLYHRLDHTEVHLDFGPTISFTIQDEPETRPQKQESKT